MMTQTIKVCPRWTRVRVFPDGSIIAHCLGKDTKPLQGEGIEVLPECPVVFWRIPQAPTYILSYKSELYEIRYAANRFDQILEDLEEGKAIQVCTPWPTPLNMPRMLDARLLDGAIVFDKEMEQE